MRYHNKEHALYQVSSHRCQHVESVMSCHVWLSMCAMGSGECTTSVKGYNCQKVRLYWIAGAGACQLLSTVVLKNSEVKRVVSVGSSVCRLGECSLTLCRLGM